MRHRAVLSIYSATAIRSISTVTVFAIDNVNELEGREDNAFRQLTEEHIGGAVQYLMTEDSMIKGLVSFCYIDRFKKWSVSDMNYLTLLGKIITSVLKKQAFI